MNPNLELKQGDLVSFEYYTETNCRTGKGTIIGINSNDVFIEEKNGKRHQMQISCVNPNPNNSNMEKEKEPMEMVLANTPTCDEEVADLMFQYAAQETAPLQERIDELEGENKKLLNALTDVAAHDDTSLILLDVISQALNKNNDANRK